MCAMMRARRHEWTVLRNPRGDDGFSYETETCPCNECCDRRHEGLGGYNCDEIPVCDTCNIYNATCTQGGTTTCFICHTPLEKEAYVLRFCEEALEQFVRAVLEYYAKDLVRRLYECKTAVAEVLESGEAYTIDDLPFILSVEDYSKEIDHYKTMCDHHTTPSCIYPTERITEICALFEEVNRLKATIFASATDAPVNDASI